MTIDDEVGYAEQAWSSFKDCDYETTLEHLSKIWSYDYFGYSDGYSTENDNLRKFIETGVFLLNYNHPITFQDTELEKQFSESIARRWFGGDLYMANAPFELSKWFGKEEPLALTLGRDFASNLGVEDVLDNLNLLGGANPIESLELLELPHHKVIERWPELVKLEALSLSARKAFVAIIKYAQLNSNLVEYSSLEYSAVNTQCRSISNEGSSIFDAAIQTLIHESLVADVTNPSELLMNISIKRLEQFVFDNKIKAHGVKKKKVDAIAVSCSLEEISDLLVKSGISGRYLKPINFDFPSLKKYIYAKSAWLDEYMKWVVNTQHAKLIPPLVKSRKKLLEPYINPYIQAKRTTRLSHFSHNYKEEYIGNPFGCLGGELSHEEMALVESIWDSKCDEIIKDLYDKYGWFASYYYSDAIEGYVPSSSVDVINNAREANPESVSSWPNIIPGYVNIRLANMYIEPKELRTRMVCESCNKEFDEASVYYSCVKKVGCKIHFCSSCYEAALMYSGDFLKISREQILERVVEFVTAFEIIPRGQDIDAPDLSMVSSEKQIAIVKALLKMPPLKQIKSEFGSWLNALVLASILPDGTKKEARGIRCIANDGHECLSLGEKSIDDWLSSHGIPHDKEPYYPYHPEYNVTGLMRADWVVGNTFIEFAGLMNNPSYFSKMGTKQEIARLSDISLIIVEPKDLLNLDKILGSL